MADVSIKGRRGVITDPVEHFWSKVDRSGGPDACWPWTLSVNSVGYGQYNNKAAGRNTTHTYAYRQSHGEIPEGLHVDHKCHNEDLSCSGGKECPHRRCCNPAHLEAVTTAVNLERANGPRVRGNQKTHCPQNHEYNEANTMWIKKVRRGKTYDTRMCRTCNRDRARNRRTRA